MNTGALMAAASATSVNRDMETSMERLSTGKRINSAADDAAGVAIASRLSSEIRGTNQAIRNAQDAQALINTAEGAHKEIETILQRMRELAVQSANDTNDASDRGNLQTEIDQLISEIDRISAATTWAGQSLLNGGSGTAENLAKTSADTKNLSFHVGAGTSVRDTISIGIGATTSAALGVGGANSVPQITATSVRGSLDNAPASISVNGDTIAVRGQLENGDTFTFDINGVEIEYAYDVEDSYTNNLAGVGAALKDEILAQIGEGNLPAMNIVDNGDGSISISQSTVPTIANLVATDSADSIPDASLELRFEGNVLTIAGDFAEDDKFSLDINGVTLEIDLGDTTFGDDEIYMESVAGVAAFVKAQIDDFENSGIKGVTVVDNGDGTLTLTQAVTPLIEAAEVAPAFAADATLTFDDTDTLTVGGEFKSGLLYELEIFGTKVSIETSDKNGFSNDLDGVAAQLSQAINEAGITGLVAEATGATVELSGVPVIANGTVATNADDDTVLTVDADAGTITIEDASAGDLLRFEVNGTQFSIKVTTDQFDDGDNGVAEQMKIAIENAGLAGVLVERADNVLTVSYDLEALSGLNAGGRSTAVTNVLVSELPNAKLTATAGKLSVEGSVQAGDTFSVVIEGKTLSITAGNDGFSASNEGVAAQLSSAIKSAGIAGVSVQDNGDGTLALSKVSVSVLSSTGAVNSIEAIDKAIQSLNTQRANLGAVSNRLDNTVSNLTNVAINLEGGRGRIEDADFAAESTALSKAQILSQASTAMLAQANASKQGVLSLLQG